MFIPRSEERQLRPSYLILARFPPQTIHDPVSHTARKEHEKLRACKGRVCNYFFVFFSIAFLIACRMKRASRLALEASSLL